MVMADGPKRPVAAVVMGLVTAALTGAGGRLAHLLFDDLCGECFFCYGNTFALVSGLVASLGTIALLAVGGWAVWRLARGRRVGALGTVFITLVVAAVVFWGLGWVIGVSMWDRCFAFFCWAGGWAVPGAVSAVCLVWGLITAWGLAMGRTLDILGDDNRQPDSADARPVWIVAEPGADLKEYPRKDQPMAHVAAGTLVTEVRRLFEQVRVATPDGLEGWVDADRLEPPSGEGGAEGGP